MKNKVLIVCLLAIVTMAFTKDKPAYLIYDSEGKSVKYKKMLKQLSDADVILFGELHNCPITHWLQLELTVDIHGGTDRKLIMGAEMFEADNQMILDEYLGGVFSEDKFEDEAKLWTNYKTDYKPLVNYAKENELAMPTWYLREDLKVWINLAMREGAILPPCPSRMILRYLPIKRCWRWVEWEDTG